MAKNRSSEPNNKQLPPKKEGRKRPSGAFIGDAVRDGVEGIRARISSKKTIVLHPTVVVLATYVLLLLSKLIDLTLLNRENEYYSVVILQMMIFLLPGAIWCIFSGEKYVKSLRLQMFRPSSILLIVSASLLMASLGLLISVLFDGMGSVSENFSLYDTFISKDNGTVPGKIYLIMAYAVLPAICEEFVYRGILCREYERGGVLRAIVFSTLFFALLHFNLAGLPIYLISGAVLALTYYATRSLIGSMIAHFLYNIFCIFGQPYLSNLYQITGSAQLFLILVATVALVSGAIFCGEAARLYRRYLYDGASAEYRQPVLRSTAAIRMSYLDVIRQPSAIACFVIYLIALLIAWI